MVICHSHGWLLWSLDCVPVSLGKKSYCNLHKHFSLSPRFFLQEEYNIWKICSGELLEEWRLTASLEMMRTHSFLTVLLWSSVFYVVHVTPSQKRTNKHSHSERITGMSENDGKTLHRTKRGWMWNQFFLLEEYTGPDTQYVGKVSLVFKGFFLKVMHLTLLVFLLLLHSCSAFSTAVVPISCYVKAHHRLPEVP